LELGILLFISYLALYLLGGFTLKIGVSFT
jgi:hypothetical protein